MKEILSSLKLLSQKLSDSNIEWYLIGKTNLALQGVNVKPRKIGILIHDGDLNKFLSIFEPYRVSDIEELKNGEAKEFFLNIQDIEIQVCAEYKHGTYWKVMDKIVSLDIDGVLIKGFSLSSESIAYDLLGDKETSKIIKKKLSSINNF